MGQNWDHRDRHATFPTAQHRGNSKNSANFDQIRSEQLNPGREQNRSAINKKEQSAKK